MEGLLYVPYGILRLKCSLEQRVGTALSQSALANSPPQVTAALIAAGAALVGVLVGHVLQQSVSQNLRRERRRRALLWALQFAVSIRQVAEAFESEGRLLEAAISGERPPSQLLVQFDHVCKALAAYDPGLTVPLKWSHQALDNLSALLNKLRDLHEGGMMIPEHKFKQSERVIHFGKWTASEAKRYLDSAVIEAYNGLSLGGRRRVLTGGLLADLLEKLRETHAFRVRLARKGVPVRLPSAPLVRASS